MHDQSGHVTQTVFRACARDASAKRLVAAHVKSNQIDTTQHQHMLARECYEADEMRREKHVEDRENARYGLRSEF